MSNGTAPGEGHPGPAGTEYTLQGVMRFLQMEWHNHERARNAWDIERAEMKAKIAKQEGECRSAKKLNDQLDKQIRMLELALKNERAKNKANAANEESKDSKNKSPDGKLGVKDAKPANKHHNSFLDVDVEPHRFSEAERESQRDKSKAYLQKCVDEITYLLMPPSLPPPPHQVNLPSLSNSSGFLNPMDTSGQLDDPYFQQRLKAQQGQGGLSNHHQYQQGHGHENNNHNNHTNHHQQPQAAYMSRDIPSQQPHQVQTGLFPPQEHPQSAILSSEGSGFNHHPEEQVEKVSHSFDAHGRPIPSKDDEAGSQPMIRSTSAVDPDAWNFEENNNLPDGPADGPRRPDTDLFPSANNIPAKSPPRTGPGSHMRRGSGASSGRRRSEEAQNATALAAKADAQNFKMRFALRGHLDVVRSVIFTGGGSPSEPEICTAGDDGLIKRWIIPASYGNFNQHANGSDLDIQSYFTHRGHEGIVTSLAACPSSATFSTGGRASGDGWIFSAGQDSTVRVWERGRVDPKATLDGHTDAVWSVCVLPATSGAVFGAESSNFGEPDRILLASGSADGTVKIWAISAPPQLSSPQSGSRRGVGGSRRHSVTSGSNFPSSPQPSIATATPIHYTLVHSIERTGLPSPTCISPLSITGETFVVSYMDSSVLIFDTRTGEEIIGMASAETYDGTPATSINSIVATSMGAKGALSVDSGRGISEDENIVHAATGTSGGGGVEGEIISGHEDQYIRFFDANSGQCTYSMLAHPSAISSLSLSKDGHEAVSAGHDASIRFWSLDKRICTQEITSHRIMRGEGVCSVVWSQDGRLVVSAGGDGVVKVFAR